MKKFGKKHIIIYGIIAVLLLAISAISFKIGKNPILRCANALNFGKPIKICEVLFKILDIRK